MRDPQSWQPVIEQLVLGHTLLILDYAANNVTGKISKDRRIRGTYRVNVRTTPKGVVAWLTKKEPQ